MAPLITDRVPPAYRNMPAHIQLPQCRLLHGRLPQRSFPLLPLLQPTGLVLVIRASPCLKSLTSHHVRGTDPADVQCCVTIHCNSPYQTSYCQNTYKTCYTPTTGGFQTCVVPSKMIKIEESLLTVETADTVLGTAPSSAAFTGGIEGDMGSRVLRRRWSLHSFQACFDGEPFSKRSGCDNRISDIPAAVTKAILKLARYHSPK